MKVFVDALGTTVGGGVTYLRGLLGALPRVAPTDEFVVAVRGAAHDYASVSAENVRFLPVPLEGLGLAARWRWEQTRLSHEIRVSGAAVLFVPHNYGVLRPPIPQVVCLQIPFAARRYAVDAKQRALWLARDAMLVATAAQTSAFVAVSDDVKRDAVATFHLSRSRVTTIHHGVDARFAPRDPAAARDEVLRRFGVAGRYVLAASDVYVHKNYGNLVKGFARAAGRLDGRSLVVAGGAVDPTESKRVQKAVARAGLGERVRFLGRVEADAMPDLYAGADVFVFPSRHEAFGLPPLEAMACGTPVAASNASCLPEVCGDAARYFPPLDPDAIGDALASVATNDGLRRDLRLRGLARSAEFTWERSARAHLAVFASAARRGR